MIFDQIKTFFLAARILICFGSGHVANDLTGTMWFTYTLIYLHYVLRFSHEWAGFALFFGQLIDGIFTPVAGILADMTTDSISGRKKWHAFGTVLVIVSFPFLFSPCVMDLEANRYLLFGYYMAVIFIYQSGWAFTQIAHMSTIPYLTVDEDSRTKFITARYTCSVLCNITAQVTSFMVFKGHDDKYGPEHAQTFQLTAYIVTTIGIICILGFQFGITEADDKHANENKMAGSKCSSWELFLQPPFYRFFILYVSTQFFVNQSQIFLPLYMEEYVKVEPQTLPMVSLVMNITGFGMALVTRNMNSRGGRRVTYIIGSSIAFLVGIGLFLGSGDLYKNYGIYFISAMIGGTSTIMSVTSSAFVTDFISEGKWSSPFVFGFCSFFDKIVNGSAVMIIQYAKSSGNTSPVYYYKGIMAFFCGGAALAGLINVVFMKWTPQDPKPSQDLEQPIDVTLKNLHPTSTISMLRDGTDTYEEDVQNTHL